MFWESVMLMTLVDVAVIGVIAALWLAYGRHRAALPGGKPDVASMLILAGLAVVALFYLGDLLVMHALPQLIGHAAAMDVMALLHLETRWLVTLLSVSLIGLGFLVFRRNVRHAIELLADSEGRFRSIVSAQNDYIVRWQPGGIRTWANEPYCRALGATLDEIIGTSFFALVDAADRERIVAEIEALMPDRPARTGSHRVRLPNGDVSWQEWTDLALFDEAGKLVEIQSVGRDVSDRVAAEEALAASEARFRGVVESTTDWVWEIDRDGYHVFSNERLQDLLGYHPGEMDGVHWHELVDSEDLEALDARWNEAIRATQGWQRWMLRVRHKDGGLRYFDSSATPMLDKHGRLVGFSGIDRDSTLFVLMHRISSKLVGCPMAEVDVRIRESLEDIGIAYGIDRISFWWLDGPHASRSHEWARAGMAGPKAAVAIGTTVPHMVTELRQWRRVRVQKLSDLPLESVDRRFLQSQGVKSTLAIPLANEGNLIGVAVFSTVTAERVWTEAIESALLQLTEKIVAAFTQALSTRRLAQSERDLIQSETLAHVGSFSYYPLTEDARFPQEWRGKFSSEQAALLEMDPDDSSFETFLSRAHPEDRPLIFDVIERLFAGEDEVELNFRVVTPSGRLSHIASRTQIDRDEQGRNLRIIGANRDITEQVERETTLTQALAEIAELKDWLEVENLRLQDEVRSIKGFEQIVGDSLPLRRCLEMVSRAAPTDAAILILGETGTGKELVAKATHQLSERREKRLVSLNCTALPEELVESELFGHERGAFTGAHRQRQGRFELANGGTMFLDEIGDLPVRLQSKLLRVIQDGTFERVGGNETIRVDVRIIAATNQDLEAAVVAGRFRADLYYRINTVTISLPALHQRREDVPALAQHFLLKHGPRLNPSVESISTGMLRHLANRDWPGNVRELENFIERSLISAHGRVLTLGEFDGSASDNGHDEAAVGNGAGVDLASFERDHIRRVLKETRWVIGGTGGAASKLGLPPSTLRSRMKKLGIERRS